MIAPWRCARVMEYPSSLPVAKLRAKAEQLREQAQVLLSRADEINMHIDALLKLVDESESPSLAVEQTNRGTREMPEAVPRPKHGDDGKSSRYGIVTGKWLKVLLALAQAAERDTFGLGEAGDAVLQEHGTRKRAADIRRQFEPYIEAGYLKKVGHELYQFTDKGFAKVGFQPQTAEPSLMVRQENEAFATNAANASETARAEQEGDHRNG